MHLGQKQSNDSLLKEAIKLIRGHHVTLVKYQAALVQTQVPLV